MKELLASIPWAMVGVAYLGFLYYVISTLADPSDESLSSVADVFMHRGKTVLCGVLCIPLVLFVLDSMGQLNYAAAGLAGYFNMSQFKKLADGWAAKQ